MYRPPFNQGKRPHDGGFRGRNPKNFCPMPGPPPPGFYGQQDNVSQNLYNIRQDFENRGEFDGGPPPYFNEGPSGEPLPPGCEPPMIPFHHHSSPSRGRGGGSRGAPPPRRTLLPHAPPIRDPRMTFNKQGATPTRFENNRGGNRGLGSGGRGRGAGTRGARGGGGNSRGASRPPPSFPGKRGGSSTLSSSRPPFNRGAKNGYSNAPKPQSLLQLNVTPPSMRSQNTRASINMPGPSKNNNKKKKSSPARNGKQFRPKIEKYHNEYLDRFGAYLSQWKDNKLQWTFDEKLHEWLLKVLLRGNVVPGDMFDIFLQQLYCFKESYGIPDNVLLLTQLLIAVKLKNESLQFPDDQQYNEDLVEISRRMQLLLDLMSTFGPEVYSQVIDYKDFEPLITRRVDMLTDLDFDYNLIGLGKHDLYARLKEARIRQSTQMPNKFTMENYLLTWSRNREHWSFDKQIINQTYSNVFNVDVMNPEVFAILLEHMKFLHFFAFEDPTKANDISQTFFFLDNILRIKGAQLQKCREGDVIDAFESDRFEQLVKVMKPIIAALGGNVASYSSPAVVQQQPIAPTMVQQSSWQQPQQQSQQWPQRSQQEQQQQQQQYTWEPDPRDLRPNYQSEENKMYELLNVATNVNLGLEEKMKSIMIYQPLPPNPRFKKNKASYFENMTQIDLDCLISTIHHRCLKFKDFIRETTEYLVTWKNNYPSWTYNPVLQRQIHDNITYNYLISDELFNILLVQIEEAKKVDVPDSKVWGYFYSHVSTMRKKLEKKEQVLEGLHIFDIDQKNRIIQLSDIERRMKAHDADQPVVVGFQDQLLPQFIDLVGNISLSLEQKLQQIPRFQTKDVIIQNGVQTTSVTYLGMSQKYFENFINTIHSEVVSFSSLKIQCIDYLRKWQNEDKDWKFDARLQKCLHIWMTYSYMIPDDIFKILLTEIECLKRVEVFSALQFENGFWNEFYQDTEMIMAKLKREEGTGQLHPLAKIQMKRAEIVMKLQKELKALEEAHKSTKQEDDKYEGEDPNVIERVEKFLELVGGYHISLEEKQKNIDVFQTERKFGQPMYMGMTKDVFKDFLVTIHERCLLHRDIKEESLQYLNKWKNDRDNWCFNKFLQTWLLKWISYNELISDCMFNCIMEQIRFLLQNTLYSIMVDWDMFFKKSYSSLELLTNFEPKTGLHDVDKIRRYRLKKLLKLRSQIEAASKANFFKRSR